MTSHNSGWSDVMWRHIIPTDLVGPQPSSAGSYVATGAWDQAVLSSYSKNCSQMTLKAKQNICIPNSNDPLTLIVQGSLFSNCCVILKTGNNNHLLLQRIKIKNIQNKKDFCWFYCISLYFIYYIVDCWYSILER